MKIYLKRAFSADFVVEHTLNMLKYFKVVLVCSDEMQGEIWDVWSDRMYQKDSLEFYRLKFVESIMDLGEEEDENKTMIFILNPESVSYGEFHKYGRQYRFLVAIGLKCAFEGYPGVEVK
jgi:hypothetical protein